MDGELVAMPPIGSQHAGHRDCVAQQCFRKVVVKTIVRVQSPIQLDDHSEPEPDLVLLRHREDFYTRSHPRPDDVLLLIKCPTAPCVMTGRLRFRTTPKQEFRKCGYWILHISGWRFIGDPVQRVIARFFTLSCRNRWPRVIARTGI